MNPNDKVVDDFRKDDSGNVIGCPHCGARAMRKDGFNYYAKDKKQMWHHSLGAPFVGQIKYHLPLEHWPFASADFDSKSLWTHL